VSSLGSLGGFVGPYVVGLSTEATGNYIPGIMVLALALGASAATVFLLGRAIKLRAAEPARQSA
jgi:nitrate/nitrite transporter NarK